MDNKPASLLTVSLGKALNGLFHLYVADRWRTRTSPGNNCEAAHQECRKRRLLGYPPMAVRLVGGGGASQS